MNILNKNQSGMVLVTVLAVIIALSIFVISYLSQNFNQSTSAQSEVDKIRAQELSIGVVSKSLSDLTQGGAVTTAAVVETMDGKAFTVTPSALSGTNLTVATAF